MRPLIGIPCRTGRRAGTDRPITYTNDAYIRVVENAGGIPLLIPVLKELSELQSLLSSLDGLLLSGGIDIHPQFYQEKSYASLDKTNPQLDEMELFLARWARRENIPTLGICRGLQVINVAFGGKLYQDLSSEYPSVIAHANWDKMRNQIIHTVQIEAGSYMEKALGVREAPVNSLHHQAIKTPGEGIMISGYAQDGIAELLEVPSHRFMLATQCHPEELAADHPVWARLFKTFVEASALQVSCPSDITKTELLAS